MHTIPNTAPNTTFSAVTNFRSRTVNDGRAFRTVGRTDACRILTQPSMPGRRPGPPFDRLVSGAKHPRGSS